CTREPRLEETFAVMVRRQSRPIKVIGPKSPVGLLVALGLLPFASRAQQALISERYANDAINAQTNTAVAPQPDSPRIGPVLLNLGTYLGVTFDDNINPSQEHPPSATAI